MSHKKMVFVFKILTSVLQDELFVSKKQTLKCTRMALYLKVCLEINTVHEKSNVHYGWRGGGNKRP